jgi:hypothetical protein
MNTHGCGCTFTGFARALLEGLVVVDAEGAADSGVSAHAGNAEMVEATNTLEIKDRRSSQQERMPYA